MCAFWQNRSIGCNGISRKQVELWRQSELTDVTAKMIIYPAFIESEKIGASKH
jgi:hypothetical protein